MTGGLRVAGGIVATLVAGASALAQPASTFHAETRLVVLYATVRNEAGDLVGGLDRSAFTVYENRQRQPVAVFRRDDVPVSLGLLIDNSGSMRTLRARVERAALAFVRASNADDEVFVVNFADKVHLDVPMTQKVADIEAGIARVDSIGGTALLDAVRFAEGYLRDRASRDRRALLVVTDGKDNASATTLKEIQAAAERSETVVYGIGLFADEDPAASQGRKELETLTSRTGGVAYYPGGIDQIEAVVVDLARQIRRQYTIGYTPSNQKLDGTYRTIRVEARSPRAGERLVVRTRPGYRALDK